MVDELSEAQLVDGYVISLLEHAIKKYDVRIDLDKPTRGQRLEAALAMKDEEHGFYSMEIMVGRRVDASEQLAQTFGFLRITETMSGNPNPRRFYEGFAHQYWPEDRETKKGK